MGDRGDGDVGRRGVELVQHGEEVAGGFAEVAGGREVERALATGPKAR